MPSLENGSPTVRQMDFVKSAWKEIRTQLENEKVRIYEEIGRYPTPIAACDQQFTYLLEAQTAISRELARLTESENESLTAADPLEVIDKFIESSPYIDPETAQIIRDA